MGDLDARLGAVPANLQALFPVWDDASTWNLQPLSPITRQVFHAMSDTEHRYKVVRHVFAGWMQDDWRVGNNLTLNLGVRYDWDSNGHSEKLEFRPFLPGNLPRDTNNVAPRVGMNLRLSDNTVLRGGYGLFFAFAPNDGVQQSYSMVHRFEYQIAQQRPPRLRAELVRTRGERRGRIWRAEADVGRVARARVRSQQQRARLCRTGGESGNQLSRAAQTSYSHQASGGIQHQIGDTMAFEANYVHTAGRLEETVHNANLSFNPATGANYPFTDISRRPFPEWGVVLLEFLEGRSEYNAADFTLTKRFSNRWQAMATYTFGKFEDRTAGAAAVVPGARRYRGAARCRISAGGGLRRRAVRLRRVLRRRRRTVG